MENVLFHGSDKIIDHPSLDGGRVHNDFGQGFYCTPSLELAREWACRDRETAFVNHYSFEPSVQLKVCKLSGAEYHTLNWLAVLMSNRVFETRHPAPREIKAYIINEFLPDLSSYDIIRGYRADDSYFSFAQAFLSNQISYSQLQKAMKLGKLGEQIVLKSQKAFDQLKFKNYEIAEGKNYYSLCLTRMEKAKAEYKKTLEDSDISGLFIRDMILGDIKNDDPRLR